MKGKKIDGDMKMMQKLMKKSLKRNYRSYEGIKNFFKCFFLYLGGIIGLSILIYNPISLAILCGTIILAILIFKLTSQNRSSRKSGGKK